MILFFYGQDTYRMKQKVKELKAKFIDSALGDTNLVILNGSDTSATHMIRQILAIPFLSRTRLVIIENFLQSGKKDDQDKINTFLVKVPSSTVLVFTEEGNPDKRTGLFKKLNQPKISQEFTLLEGEALRRALRKEIQNQGASIDPLALQKLIDYVGNDLWRLNQEINKLISYDKNITAQNIELLLEPQIQANIFDLIEEAARKNPERAQKELSKLIQSGQNEIYILTMLVFQYRNLLMVKDAQNKNPRANKWVLAKELGLNPYVLSKTINLTPNYTLENLKSIYQRLLDFETYIKTGKMEPRVALELLVFKLTK